MKTFVSLSCTLLSAAVGSMLCAQIRKTGTEGNVAVIQCPYAKGYEAYLKYFCKGTYKDCVSVVKTDGKEPWAFQGRFSLHDNTEKKMFVVTITALRIEDTGQYCCGIESVGSDPFTVVQLTLLRLHNLNPHPSPLLHSTPTPLKCENVCEHTGLSLSTNGTGNATETGNSTQPSGTFIYAGGVFITVLLVLPITSGIFFALRCRADKSLPNSQENMENFPLYEEMQQSDPTHTNVSVSTNQGPVPPTDNAMTTHQHSDPPPACSTIYTQQMKSANERCSANQRADTTTPCSALPQILRSHPPLALRTPAEDPRSYAECRDLHPEPMVSSFIRLPQTYPLSTNHEPPSTLSRSLSLQYIPIDFGQLSLIANDNSPFLGKSQVVYTTVQWHKEPGGSTYGHHAVI
ncbi:uncharacterized protein LOC118242606 isoform X3 [Electrophorus electricus]|uniref:uncharacterized protein LOC118242606 isoform X3 n=1 Tax=Electrophorus electricus TaxID=8005 RepID=UPI0015CF8338|nr:uncharacterized protein LOC118242606 isoform X3 [Electrophorus electricus]